MSKPQQRLTMYTPTVFLIRIQGILDEIFFTHFAVQTLSVEENDSLTVTTVTSKPMDQAALIGLINHLNALGQPLISVEHIPNTDHPLERLNQT